MAITNRRYLKDTVIAVAHQTAYGTPAATTTVLQLWCSQTAIDPVYKYVDTGRGTSGSYHPKDTHVKVAEEPKASLTMPCTKRALAFFAEHAFHGQPTATQAASDLSIANDAGSYLSLLVLNGVRPHLNTDALWKLYVSVIDGGAGTGHTVNVYEDSGRTALVATGTGNDSASVTLAESNSSGLSGTVTLGTISGDDIDIVVTLAQVRPQRAGAISRWFTLWRDSGQELERVIDCTVAKLKRSSKELGPVVLEVDLVGSTHEGGLSTTFTAALTSDDKDVYLHDSVAYTSDTGSASVAESVFGVDVELKNDIQVDLHNATTPTAIWKRAVDDMRVTVEQRFADEAKTILTRVLADSWTAEQLVDTHDSKAATWTFDRAKPLGPKLADTDEREWKRLTQTFLIREKADGSAAPFTLTIQGP